MKPTHKQKAVPPNALIQSKDVENEMKSSLSSFSFQIAAFSQSVEEQLENILHLELQ